MTPAYIINLPRDTARRQQIEAQLADLPFITPHFVTGVDGGTLPDQVCEKLSDSAFWASHKGTIGCFLSHVRAWEQLAATNAAYGLILEDDVDISGLQALERLHLPADFECVFINDRMSPKFGGDGVVSMAEALGQPGHTAAFGGDGYILTPGAAAKLVAACVTDLYFGHVDGRLARYATSPEDLDALGDTKIETVLRTHHLKHRLPKLGLLKSYVAATPLVRFKVYPSSRAMLDEKAPPAEPPKPPQPAASNPLAAEMLHVLEAPRTLAFRRPDFIANAAGADIALDLPGELRIHGSNLVQGLRLRLSGASRLTRAEGAQPEAAEPIETPVFLATALAPEDWGSWILTVLPKIPQYRQYGEGRKFLCHAGQNWQRNLLRELGISEDLHLDHDPGRDYICRDLMTVAYSEVNGTVSAVERMSYFERVATNPFRGRRPPKILVSEAGPPAGLAALLEPRGFVSVARRDLSLAEQIGLFSAAETLVCAGPALFNAAFCAPGAKVMCIAPDASHAAFLASLEMEYAFVLGAEPYTLDRLEAWLG
jgi:capsular polysaccharide biosynthesis protein